MSDHAKYSASGSARWLNCPGSIALCEKAPEQRESEYAAEGTKAHKCLDFLLKNRNSAGAQSVAYRKYDDEIYKYTTNAATWILEHQETFKDSLLFSETEIDSSSFTCADQFGTLDAAIIQEFGRLTIIDFKYGAGIAVDPDQNTQLIYYALGVSNLYHHNFVDVELVIIQPRAYHESGETIRSVIIPIEELLAWIPKFQAGVKACENPKAKTVAGSWCRFCAAAPICPELKDKALKQAQIVFDDTNGLESMPEPRMIQLPNLGVILTACDRLEDWIKNVRDHAVHVLERGEDIEGFKLVEKRSPRRWVDEAIATGEARISFGKLAFTEPKLLSPAQLEKAAKGSKGLNDWIEARVTSKSSGTTLVSASDKRPAVKPIQQVFAAPKQLPAALNGKLDKVKRK